MGALDDMLAEARGNSRQAGTRNSPALTEMMRVAAPPTPVEPSAADPDASTSLTRFGRGMVDGAVDMGQDIADLVGVDNAAGKREALFPRQKNPGMAGNIGNVAGELSTAVVPGGLALKGLRMAGAGLRMGKNFEAAGRALMASGAMGTQAGTMGLAGRGLAAATGGAVAGAASAPGDMQSGAIGGAIGGPVGGAIGHGISRVAPQMMQAIGNTAAQARAVVMPGSTRGLADQAIGGAVGARADAVLRKLQIANQKRGGDAVPGASVAEQAADPGVSMLHRFGVTRNNDAMGIETALGADASQTAASKLLRDKSSGLKADIAARQNAVGGLSKKIADSDAEVSLGGVQREYENLSRANAGRPAVTKPLDAMMRNLGDEGAESTRVGQAFNARRSKNDILRGNYDGGSPLVKLDKSAQNAIGKLGSEVREAMYKSDIGETVREFDKMYQKLSVPIDDKKFMRLIWDKTTDNVKLSADGKTELLSAAVLRRQINAARRDRPELWKKLSPTSLKFLTKLDRELRRNSAAPRLGLQDGMSATAQLENSTVMPKELQRALGEKGFSSALPGSIGRWVNNTTKQKADDVADLLAQDMSSPDAFMATLRRLKKQGSFPKDIRQSDARKWVSAWVKNTTKKIQDNVTPTAAFTGAVRGDDTLLDR